MDLEYEEKFAEMKKYIPFLENMIQRLEHASSSGNNPREAQLRKIQSLRSLLLDRTKKMKMENLRKCEQVLINLYAKVEKNDTLPGVSKTLPDVTFQPAVDEEMSKLQSVRDRLQQVIDTHDQQETRHQLMSVCHKVEKEPALFQRRPSKPSTASSGDDAPTDSTSKRKYTRLLVSPEPHEQNWLNSEVPLYHRRTPKKSPRKRSPRVEKVYSKRGRERQKHRDGDEINITLNVPKKTLSSLNTEDILDRIISCPNNDVDIDQLSSLRSQIIQELKHTGGNQDISDFILKSYKKRNKQKTDEVEEGELSDSESESIEKIYGNLVIELKNDLNDVEQQNNLEFFSSLSKNDDDNNTKKIKITLVTSNQNIESENTNFDANVCSQNSQQRDNKELTVHGEELTPSPKVKSKALDSSQIHDNLIESYKPNNNIDLDSIKDNESKTFLDKEINIKPNLANFYVPLQDHAFSKNTLVDSIDTVNEIKKDDKSSPSEIEYKQTESNGASTNNEPQNINVTDSIKKQLEYHESNTQIENREMGVNITSRDKELDNKTIKNINSANNDIPFLSNESKNRKGPKGNVKISEIDILKALKNEILSESIDVPNTSNTPALHLPKITKVTDKIILDNKKKRISLEKYKEKSVSTTKTPLFVNDPNFNLNEDQPKKQGRGLTEKECDRFKFFANLNSCILSSDDDSDCKDINDIIYANFTPKSSEPDELQKPLPIIIKGTSEKNDENLNNVDIRQTKTPIPFNSGSKIPKSELPKGKNTDEISSPSSQKNNEDVKPKDTRYASKDAQHVDNIKDPRKPLLKELITSKVTHPLQINSKSAPNQRTINQNYSYCPSTPNQYFNQSEISKPHLLPTPNQHLECPRTPSHHFGRSDCPRTPSHPFGRSDCPSTPSHPFGRSDCPTTPSHPFGRSDCPTTPSHPFGRSDCPTTPSHPFGRSDCPTTPSHPFGRSDCPTTPSHPFGRSDCPTTPSHPFGRSDCPTTPSHPFGRSDCPTTPSHPFGRSDCSTTPSHPFGRSDCPTTSCHPFGLSECPRTPNHPFGRSEFPSTSNPFGRSEKPVTPNPYNRYERSTTPSRRSDCPSTPSHPFGRSTPNHLFGRSDAPTDTINHNYAYSDCPSTPNHPFGRSGHSNDLPEYATTGNSYNRSDRCSTTYRRTNVKTFETADVSNSGNKAFPSTYNKYSNYKSNEDTAVTSSSQQYPYNNKSKDFNKYSATYNKYDYNEHETRLFSREQSISSNFKRESNVSRRDPSTPRREVSVSRQEPNVHRREQSIPRREQSIHRGEQGIPRREQSVPRRDIISKRDLSVSRDSNDSSRDTNINREEIFGRTLKNNEYDNISNSLAIGFDNRSFVIDTSVSRTFQDHVIAAFKDRRKRASSVGRFDTDDCRTIQSPNSIDHLSHFRSNFTRAHSVGRDFDKHINNSPNIEFDYKSYKSKSSKTLNTAQSVDKHKNQNIFNHKKQIPFNKRDPRNKQGSYSMKIQEEKHRSINTKDLHRNRDPRLNRQLKESPNKYRSSRHSNEYRYETERKHGIVYTNDNIAKGNILGPGYGVKNYKIPKIKRVEEEKIENSTSLSKSEDDIKKDDQKEIKKKISEKSKETVSNKSKETVSNKSKETVSNKSKETVSNKSKETVSDKSKETVFNKSKEAVTENSKKNLSEKLKLTTVTEIVPTEVTCEKTESYLRSKSIKAQNLLNTNANEIPFELTDSSQDKIKNNIIISKEIKGSNDDDEPICTRTRRRRMTLISETDSENNMGVVKDSLSLVTANSLDLDIDSKANNSFDSRDLDLFSDTDKTDTGVIENIIANLDIEIDKSNLYSKNSCSEMSNDNLKILNTSLLTENTKLSIGSIAVSEKNIVKITDEIHKNTDFENTYKLSERNSDSTKDLNIKINDLKEPTNNSETLLQSSLDSTTLSDSIPKDNRNDYSFSIKTTDLDNNAPSKITNVCNKNVDDSTVSTSNSINDIIETSSDCVSKPIRDSLTNRNNSIECPSTVADTNAKEISSMSVVDNEVQGVEFKDNIPNTIIPTNESENIINVLPDSTNELPTDSEILLGKNKDNEPEKPTSDDSKLKAESLGNLLSLLQNKSKMKELLDMINESTESEKIKRKLEKLTTIVSDDEEIVNETEVPEKLNKIENNELDKCNDNNESVINNNDSTKTDTAMVPVPSNQKSTKECLKKKVVQKRRFPKKRRKRCAGKVVNAKNSGTINKRITRSGALSKKGKNRELLMLQEDIKEVFSSSDNLVNPSGLRMCRLTKLVNENNKANKKEEMKNNLEEPFGDEGVEQSMEKTLRKKPIPKPKLKPLNLNDLSETQDKEVNKVKSGPKGKKGIESVDPYEFDVDHFSESSKTVVSPCTSESDDDFLNKSFGSSSSTKKTKIKRKNTPWQLGVISRKPRKKKSERTISKESLINDDEKDIENEIFVDKAYCFKKNEDNYICKFCDYQGTEIVRHFKQFHPHYEVPLSRFDPQTSNEAIQQSLVTDFKSLQNVVTKKHVCRFCFKVFNGKQNNLKLFYNHVLSKHTGEYAQECSLCKDPKKCTYILDVPPIPNDGLLLGFICGECNYTQLSLENLKTHVALRHDNEQTAVYAINIGDMTQKKIKMLTAKAKNNVSEDDLPIKSLLCDLVSSDQNVSEVEDNKPKKMKSPSKRPGPASRKIQSKITFENEMSETEGTVIKKEIVIDDNNSITMNTDSKSEENKLLPDRTQIINPVPLVNSDKCATENLFTEAHFKINITENGIKEYVCCINGTENHYKTSLLISIKKHVQLKHKEIWDGYCNLCKVIVTTQGIHYFKDCWNHVLDKHLDELPTAEIPKQTEIPPEPTDAINIPTELVIEKSSVVPEKKKPYINVRPLFELMDNVPVKTPEVETADSMALPRIESVVSLTNDDSIIDTPEDHAVFESENKVVEKKIQMDLDAAQVQIFKDKHRVVIDTMLTPGKLVQYFKCAGNFCSFTCDSPEAAILHVISHQRLGGIGALKCAYCAHEVDNGIDLVSHVFNEHGHCQYSCNKCFYRAVSGSYVESHVQRIHNQAKVQGCVLKAPALAPGCQIPSDQGRPSHTDVVLLYTCFKNSNEGKCKFRHYTQGKFVEHLQQNHPHDTTFECSYCPEKCDSPQALLKHLQKHEINVYQCTWCVHGSNSKAAMVEHVSIKHPTHKVNAYFRHILQNNKSAMRILPVVNIDKMVTTPEEVAVSNEDEPLKEVERAIQLENLIGATNKMIAKDKENTPATRTPTPVDMPQEVIVVEPPAPAVTPPPTNNIQEQTTPLLTGGVGLETSSPITRRSIILESDDEDHKRNIPVAVLNVGVVASDVVDLTEDDAPTEKRQSPRRPPVAARTDRLPPEDLFTCGNCRTHSRTAPAYKRHVSICKDVVDGRLLCGHCPHTGSDRVDMVAHYLAVHAVVLDFACSICQHEEPNLAMIRKHMAAAHDVAKVKTKPGESRGVQKTIAYPRTVRVPYAKKKPTTKRKASVETARKSYGPDDVDRLPINPILDEPVLCAVCDFSTKVRLNMVRHLRHHRHRLPVASTAPVNPVPHLDSNEMHFDKMTNLASSSAPARAPPAPSSVPAQTTPEIARYPRYVPDRTRLACGALGCLYISVDEATLRAHWEALHADFVYYRCVHCPPTQQLSASVTLSAARVVAHLRMHDARLYACPFCSYYHHARHVAEKHLRERHSQPPDRVVTVREPGVAAMPVVAAPTMDLKPWQCGLCRYSSMLRSEVVDHCWTSHKSKTQLKCVLCPFRCSELGRLYEHAAEAHAGSRAEPLYYFYREGSVADEPDGTPRWLRQMRELPLGEAQRRQDVDDPPEVKPCVSPTPPASAAQIDLNIVKAEAIDESEMTQSSLEDSFGKFCEPRGNKFVCPLCDAAALENKEAMISHLYEELNYRKWACSLCSYKGFHRNGLMEHALFEHRKTQDPISLPPDARIEKWVSELIRHQEHIILKEPDTLESAKGTPKIQPAPQTPVPSDPSTDDPKTTYSKEELEKAFGEFGQSTRKEFACPKCEFKVSDETKMTDHLESELAKVRWICGICTQKFQTYHQVQLHSKSIHCGETSNIVEASRDPRLRSSWISAVVASQRRLISEVATAEVATAEEQTGDDTVDNSLLIVRYAESLPTPDAPATTKPAVDSDDERLVIDEEDEGSDLSSPESELSNKGPKLQCKYCHHTTQNKSFLERHMYKHYKLLKPFKCGYCEYTCRKFIKRHLAKVHRGLPEKYVKMPLPDTPPEWVRPRITLSGGLTDPEFGLVCLVCETAFGRLDITEHMETTHEATPYMYAEKDTSVYMCCSCLTLWKDKDTLNAHHLDKHRSEKLRYSLFRLSYGQQMYKIICSYCPRKLWCVRDLKKHHESFHCNQMYDSPNVITETGPAFAIPIKRSLPMDALEAPVVKKTARKSTTKLPG